jgi:ketosteroid isomerase-like protein
MIQTHATRFLFSGLVVLLFASFAIGEGFSQDVGDEVEQVIKNFLVPFSSGKVSEFMEYFADDATAFFPSSPLSPSMPAMRIQGKNNIAREFEALFKGVGAGAGGIIQPQNLLMQRFDDTAIVTFHLGTDMLRGRRTFVLRRIGSRWKIVHLHASAVLITGK